MLVLVVRTLAVGATWSAYVARRLVVTRSGLRRLVLWVPDRVLVVKYLTLIFAHLWLGLAFFDANFRRRLFLYTSLHVNVCFYVSVAVRFLTFGLVNDSD